MGKVLEFYVSSDEVLSDDIINHIKEYNKQVSDLENIGRSIRSKAIACANKNLSIPDSIRSEYFDSPSVTLIGGSLEPFSDKIKVEIKNMHKEEQKPKAKDTMASKLQKAGLDPMQILNSGALNKEQKQLIISEILEG